MYWGLTALDLLDRLHEVDQTLVIEWVLSCRQANGGFGGSPRNDPHLLYTLSAVQILALYDRLDLLDVEEITKCGYYGLM
jgi:geranylgeranyl transferase type-2 subunit beta